MRILFLSTWYPHPPDNGSKIRVYHLLKALAQRHEVTVAAFHPDSKTAALPSDLEGICIHPVQADPYHFVNAPQWARFASPIPLAYWPSREMHAALTSLCAAHTWDAVIAVQTPVARYALMVPNVPRVLEIDTSLSFQMHERFAQQHGGLASMRAWASWKKTELYERRVFRRFGTCTIVSRAELELIKSMLGHAGTKLEVVPNGVDCQHNRPIYPHAPYTLVYNGALTYSANYDAMRFFLAEVYPLVQRALPRVTLTITGSTRGVDLGSLALDDSVRLSGYVDNIRPVVGGAAACVVPLRQGGGTRLKILEAMALGTPVVSTTKGAEGLDLRADEHLLLADTPTDLAAATVRVLTDAALADALAQRARALVEAQYDWAAIGDRFVDLVEHTVNSHV